MAITNKRITLRRAKAEPVPARHTCIWQRLAFALCGLVAALATLASPAAADSVLCIGQRYLGFYSDFILEDVAVAGDTVYMASGAEGLVILDISDPDTPTLLGTYDTPGNARSVIVSGTTAYVADTGGGLVIIDVTDPTTPTLLATYTTTPRFVIPIFLSGTTLYIGSTQGGLNDLLAIDVSNPAAPTLIGSLNLDGFAIRQIAISGNVAYVSDGSSAIALRTIDITDPASMSILGAYNNGGSNFDGLTVIGTTVYCNESNRMLILDASDPAAISVVSSTPTAFLSSFDLAIVGTTAYVISMDAHDSGALEVFDISNPASPTRLFMYSSTNGAISNPNTITVADSKAFITELFTGLQIIDVSGSPTSPQLGALSTPGRASDVAVDGTTAYLSTSSGLQIIDVSDSGAPASLALMNVGEGTTVIDAAVAYVAGTAFTTVDVSNPASPSILGSFNGGGLLPLGFSGVALSGTMACTVHRDLIGGNSFLTLDISNPANPTLIGSVAIPNMSSEIAIVGNRAYVANGASGLLIFDLTNPASPTLIGSFNPGQGSSSADVFVVGTTVYLAATIDGLKIIDASNPASPSLLSTFDTPQGANSVIVDGTTAYVAAGDSGMLVIDVSDPADPTLIANHDTVNAALGVAVADQVAYLAHFFSVGDPDDDLLILDMSPNCGSGCVPDFTDDGVLNFFDVMVFLDAFSAEDPAADLTNDGVFDLFDVTAFLDAFSAGCP